MSDKESMNEARAEESKETAKAAQETNEGGAKAKSNKGVIIALIIVIVILLLGGAALLIGILFGQSNEQIPIEGIKEEPNVFLDDESAEEYLKDRVSNIKIGINMSVATRVAENGKQMALANIRNENDFQIKVDLLLADNNGELIGETGIIPAGGRVPEVELKRELPRGTYNVSALFYAISSEDNQTNLGSTGMSVEMNVQ